MKVRSHKWLVLIYSLPAGAGSSRVRIWRKLKKMGAVSFRSSVYFLPHTEEYHELIQWLCEEIQKDGGEATLLTVDKIENLSDAEVISFFRLARDEEYAQLVKDIEEWLAASKDLVTRKKAVDVAQLKKFSDELRGLEKRFAEIEEVDFFNADGRPRVVSLLKQARQTLRSFASEKKRPAVNHKTLFIKDFKGKTWVTRPRPHVDRIATAWVISRFFDDKSKFVFADAPEEFPAAIPFDYPKTELSHQGEDCTVETLIKRFDLNDKALKSVAEVIHDADLKDSKFGREEAGGFDRLVRGFAKLAPDSDVLLKDGFKLLDALYAAFGEAPKRKKARTRKS